MQNLTVIENELVPVYMTSTGEKVVYGTELHEVLQVGTPYRIWADRRFSDCEAIENEDFQGVQICTPSGQTKKDHIIKIDTAKEMAMLERNEKGKQVRRYFIEVEKKYKSQANGQFSDDNTKFLALLHGLKFVADDLKIAESSRLFMYDTAFKDFGLPTNALPHYEDNGNRERKSLTELLKNNGYEISAMKFNQLLVSAGILEIKERKSSKGIMKPYKALTEKGLKYGVNLISDKNQKETQPYYYTDKFKELYELVIK